jgi:hypothetical protein
VQLEAADLLGRLRDGWTRPAAVLVDAAEPRRVHDRFHDGLRLRWEVSTPSSRLAPVTMARRPSSNRSISAMSGSKRWRAIPERDRQAHDQDGEDADVVGDVRHGAWPDPDRGREQPDQHAEGR